MIAIDDLESLEETLAVLQNEKVMRDLALDNPQRVGKPLRAPLDGKHSARRGQYRVSYGIDVAENTVTVLAVSHRRDASS
ncbi:MAG: type II toxin-antitoxin system RelE/ParE family toxin [Lapillicoccus sp.]